MNSFSAENKPQNSETEIKCPLKAIHVEDDEAIRALVKIQLGGVPNEIQLIESFPDTETAEEYLKVPNNKPDLIISDNNLGNGKRKGVDFVKWVRSQKDLIEVPFILLTADSVKPGSIAESIIKKNGVTAIVSKFDLPALIPTLKTFIPQQPAQK